MNKKKTFGIFLITIFLISFFIIFSNVKNSNDIITNNFSRELTSSLVNITHPSDLELDAGDLTNQTISWALTNEDEGPFDYLGTYSFTDDSNGADPTGWLMYEDSGTNIQVIEELEGHRKVVEIYDASSSYRAAMTNFFQNITSGTIEFWCYGERVGVGFNTLQVILINEPTRAIYLMYDIAQQKLQFFNGTLNDICAFSNNVWQHIQLTFNCSTNTFGVWVNGTLKGSGLSFENNVSQINRIHFYSGVSATGGFYSYVDAIDYSWAPGYSTNRNMGVGPLNYLGEFSFTNDSVGSDPSGWTIDENPGNHIEVGQSIAGHNKVVEIWDDTGSYWTQMVDSFPSQTAGTVEFYLRRKSGWTAGHGTIWVLLQETGTRKTGIILWDYQLDHLGGAGGGTIMSAGNWQDDNWYHFRLEFDCVTDQMTVWINGSSFGSYNFDTGATSLDAIEIFTYTFDTRGNTYCYLDAIDYSWSTGYYLNRNMDYTFPNSTLKYAIFQNNSQMTGWQTWSNQVQVNYDVSGTGLGMGTHNISLVYTDDTGNLNHDDVIVTVTSSVVIDWNVAEDLDYDVDPWKDRQCEISFKFNNTGTATFLLLNFTINLPEGWSADATTKLFASLAPNEEITVDFIITTPSNEKEFIEELEITFQAFILETTETYEDTITIYVVGKKAKNLMLWLVLIIGSAVAAVGTTFIVIRRRQEPLEGVKMKKKYKSGQSFKTEINVEFPGTYSAISPELMEQIIAIQGITDEERKLLIQDLAQLDAEEAKEWIDEFKKSLFN